MAYVGRYLYFITEGYETQVSGLKDIKTRATKIKSTLNLFLYTTRYLLIQELQDMKRL